MVRTPTRVPRSSKTDPPPYYEMYLSEENYGMYLFEGSPCICKIMEYVCQGSVSICVKEVCSRTHGIKGALKREGMQTLRLWAWGLGVQGSGSRAQG